MGDAAAWPAALARAELGDSTVAPELETLLGSARGEVRAAAARLLGQLRVHEALRTLETLAASDPEPSVRDEAVIAATALGADTSLVRSRELAEGADDVALRAALVLAERADPSGSRRLGVCVEDDALDEVRRRACVVGLGRAHARDQLGVLVRALADVRLRADVADALGALGDRAAADPLARALANERYIPPRLPMIQALAVLGDRRVDALAARYLGMDSGVPNGVGLLLELGRLGRPSATRGDLRDATLAAMRCDGTGCAPTSASAPVPFRGRSSDRVVARFVASEGAFVTFTTSTGARVRLGPLREGAVEAGFVLTSGATYTMSVEGSASLMAYVVVPSVAELPPPAAEPWSAGEDNENAPSP